MVKKEEGQETEVFGQKISPEPEPEVKTPTAEEQLATLQEQINSLAKERDEAKKGLSTAHSQLTKRDQELKKQADLSLQIDELRDVQRFLVGAMQERGIAPDDETLESKRPDYLKGFDDYVKQKKQERENAQTKARQEEYNRQADALYAEAKEVLKDDEESLEKIEDLLMSGRFERAQSKLEKAKTKTSDTPKESEDARVDRLAEEKLRKLMEEKGLLGSDAGGPGGPPTSEEKIKEAYRKNPNDPKAYTDYKELYFRKRGKP